MTLEDLALPIIFGAFALFLALDHLRPGRAMPAVPLWRAKGVAFFIVSFVVSSALPFVWDEWFAEHRLIDLTSLGVLGGVIVGLLVQQFIAYWWHRTMHRTPFLWRWLHQMHHSAERIDIYGALYFNPLDIAGFTLVNSVGLVLVVGIVPEAALIVALFLTVVALFQHANLRTPRWLGYFIARPESHSVHHQRGLHAFNYGDVPIWDIVFGTFRNPARFIGDNGFYDGASRRVPEMLIGRDVSTPPGADARAEAHPPAMAA